MKETKKVAFSPYQFSINNPEKVIYSTSEDDSNKVKVTEVAPKIFHELRKKFNVSEATIMKSFEPSKNI
eukprot:CAMPEP_0176395324 /NCGR_PEP_ID=MMETSP0126-20121128/43315_1 /TAXON_ID=141414 ORGANISM="Strombidinopsis acuminatum, Strain SPMC142" /NCGR_SAMPLE_ID=MMETSP0126 /ASSEMBLY_ACC=CAM_ASM_000229 /LENGTH=68 /DNA_ID=CAMNT_0017768129 /DNA_START=650 /DNA_END=856 /DNA_ORIENTATION=-